MNRWTRNAAGAIFGDFEGHSIGESNPGFSSGIEITEFVTPLHMEPTLVMFPMTMSDPGPIGDETASKDVQARQLIKMKGEGESNGPLPNLEKMVNAARQHPIEVSEKLYETMAKNTPSNKRRHGKSIEKAAKIAKQSGEGDEDININESGEENEHGKNIEDSMESEDEQNNHMPKDKDPIASTSCDKEAEQDEEEEEEEEEEGDDDTSDNFYTDLPSEFQFNLV
jgi:hypothetical protein